MPREKAKYPTVPVTAEELYALQKEIEECYGVLDVVIKFEPVSSKVVQAVIVFGAYDKRLTMLPPYLSVSRKIPLHKLYYLIPELYAGYWEMLDEIERYRRCEEDLPF